MILRHFENWFIWPASVSKCVQCTLYVRHIVTSVQVFDISVFKRHFQWIKKSNEAVRIKFNSDQTFDIAIQ